MADKEYYSFEEVLKDLKLEENELKRLVSAGEIRAFRDKNTMRFKAEDVARLRTTDEVTEDVELDDLDLDLDDAAPPPAPVAEETPTDELVLEDAVVEETITEEIDLAAEAPADEPAAKPARGTRESKRTTRVATVETAEPKDSPLVVGALLAGELLLLLAAIVIFDAVTGAFSNPVSEAVANMFG